MILPSNPLSYVLRNRRRHHHVIVLIRRGHDVGHIEHGAEELARGALTLEAKLDRELFARPRLKRADVMVLFHQQVSGVQDFVCREKNLKDRAASGFRARVEDDKGSSDITAT